MYSRCRLEEFIIFVKFGVASLDAHVVLHGWQERKLRILEVDVVVLILFLRLRKLNIDVGHVWIEAWHLPQLWLFRLFWFYFSLFFIFRRGFGAFLEFGHQIHLLDFVSDVSRLHTGSPCVLIVRLLGKCHISSRWFESSKIYRNIRCLDLIFWGLAAY